MTERITEDFVRAHFKADPIFDQVALEEQQSTRDRVKKLFAHASKNGTGQPGYPEFIISFASRHDLLIVVECKQDKNDHKSTTHNKPKKYAVDGLIHYINAANSVDDSFDIIGIAVSGSDPEKLAITHFYSPADSDEFYEKNGKDLLSIQSYLKLSDNEAFAKELSDVHIQQKAVEYNNILHNYEIPEHERCTLISAVLVALQDDFFRKSFKKSSNVVELVDLILESCTKVLKKNGITEDRRETILLQYSNIKGHKITQQKLSRNMITGKEEENEAILEFVDAIHTDIYPLVQFEEQGFDVLGRFYREFVRYAGSDQSSGLVLTPEHIADLFCELVHLTVDDRVYDPCCGTAGFLISALKKMISLAGDNSNKIKAIKKSQLMGSEVRSDMFTYACSNMMMRGDGKSQVFNEDCFSSSQRKRAKEFIPTVAMLNPPYSKATTPARQLEFVLNALRSLEKNGRCAAIVQMSCALVSRSEVVSQHAELLDKHRLDAVISLPDQLFYPIAVNTCIMVFTAHVPHPAKHPTWFGYLKDDGFTIHKKKGRVPFTWNEKRAKFLSLYSHFDAPGLSVRSHVGAEDEWCAEAYLETDFTVIREENFQTKLRDYLGYQFVCGNLRSIVDKAASNQKQPLKPKQWKSFRYDAVFDIKNGYYNKKPPSNGDETSGIPFIGATAFANGVTSWHELDDVVLFSRNGDENPYEDQGRKLFPGNCVTVSNNGSVGNAFYQPNRFTCSHDVNPLYIKDGTKLTAEIGVFLCAVIEMEKYRWGYGRKWRPTRMPSSIIKLPVDQHGKPSWSFMADYVRGLDLSLNLKDAVKALTAASSPSKPAKQEH